METTCRSFAPAIGARLKSGSRIARRRAEEEGADTLHRLRATTKKADAKARSAASGASNETQ